jgi:hypothetical protein
MYDLHREGKKVEGELMSFLDIARNLEKSTLRDQIQQQSGVVFDPSEFKKTKDREVRLRFSLFNCSSNTRCV